MKSNKLKNLLQTIESQTLNEDTFVNVNELVALNFRSHYGSANDGCVGQQGNNGNCDGNDGCSNNNNCMNNDHCNNNDVCNRAC